MKDDGLYRVENSLLCAGFVVKRGRVVCCAPILRRFIEQYRRIAIRIEETRDENPLSHR